MLLLSSFILLGTCPLLHELWLAQQLLAPQVRLYGLHAALCLRSLQDCLGDVGLHHLLSGLGLPSRCLPRLPGLSLCGLRAVLILPGLGRPAGLGRRSCSLLLLPGLLRGAEAGHGAQSIQGCMRMRGWMPHAGPWTSLRGTLQHVSMPGPKGHGKEMEPSTAPCGSVPLPLKQQMWGPCVLPLCSPTT